MELEEIYRTYFDDVYRYIRRLSGDEHIAEEVTADTFFRAMKALHRFRGDCDMRVWLCQIAKNCYYSAVKKDRHLADVDEATLQAIPDPDASIDDALLRREEAERIRAILHTLPEPYREVFMWRVFAELSFRQIGALFDKSENWACVTYHRARKMIISQLEGSNHENRM